MNRTRTRKLILICAGALLLRLAVLPFVHHPGIADPNHYYNMGVRLVQGQGFTIDYIWQYSLPPQTIVHPEEHWMPLAAALAAGPMAVFGIGVPAALSPFIVIGSLLPLLAYAAAKQFGLGEDSRLFAAATTAVLPEFVLNSLRTDTTIPDALFVCACIVLMTQGLKRLGSTVEIVKPHPRPLPEFGEGRVISDQFAQSLPLSQQRNRETEGDFSKSASANPHPPAPSPSGGRGEKPLALRERGWGEGSQTSSRRPRRLGGSTFFFIASGICAGLSYLTRNDGSLLLPTLGVTLLVYRRWQGLRWRDAGRALALFVVAAGLVIAPWIVRNLQTIGTPTSPETRNMFFFTDHSDHYEYGRQFSLQTMLTLQTPAQIIGKRLFELAAAVKVTYTSLDVFLPVAVFGGLILLALARDRDKGLTLSPALILLLGSFIAYPLLLPYKSQAGSFKKAYLVLIPLLIPLAGYALERAVAERRLRIGVMALAVVFMAANGFELARSDEAFLDTYLASVQKIARTVDTLPDTNGDGKIILMAQDPFMLRFFGIQSVMIPAENRETVLAVARRYGVDYLLMPAGRPALDPLYNGTETDPRFVRVAQVMGTNFELYGLNDHTP